MGPPDDPPPVGPGVLAWVVAALIAWIVLVLVLSVWFDWF
jgi:hypothetical protein